MLDPGLEHIHRHGRVWRASNKRRKLINGLVVDGMFFVPAILLFLFAPTEGWASPWVVGSLLVVFVLASLVRFEIGSGSTSPLELVLVPMWFAVPPAYLAVVVGAGLVLGGLVEHLRDQPETPIFWSLLHAGDAWPAIGPAIVFTAFGVPEPTLDAVPLVVGAVVAQFTVDIGVNLFNSWYLHRIRPSIQIKLLAWISTVDASLAPVGFLTAVVMAHGPVAIIALVPLIVIIGEFARERTDRLEQALQLSSAYRGTAQLMGDVLEADDAYTGGEHTQGVVDMAVEVGLELRLDPRQMRDLEFGALLHDIGKLRVPNEIINKPGQLDAAEWELIRKHPEYGQQMLDRVGGALMDAGRIVRAHHERWDGMGYPDRLREEEIPLAARIITVCDSFSAMTTNRSYSHAMTKDEALAELDRCSGTQFDPTVVAAVYALLERNPGFLSSARSVDLRATSPVAAALGLRSLA